MKTVSIFGVITQTILFFTFCNYSPTINNEGTLKNPINLSIDIPRNGQIAANGDSYYWFKTDEVGRYTISLTNTQSDLSWWLFDDRYFSNLLWCCDNNYKSIGDEIEDTPILDKGTVYYLMVSEWSGVAGTFTVTVSSPSSPSQEYLDGTWTLNTENISGEDVGDGTYTISLVAESPELEIIFYSGEAEMSVNGTPTSFNISVEQRYGSSSGSTFYLYLCDDLSKKFEQSIRMEGDLSDSSSASGTYEGIGTEYEKYGTGTFVASKQ
jgi:hypothetical protein